VHHPTDSYDQCAAAGLPLVICVALLTTGCVVEKIDAIIAERGVTECPSSTAASDSTLDTSTDTTTSTNSSSDTSVDA
jgi:hypothetical protein